MAYNALSQIESLLFKTLLDKLQNNTIKEYENIFSF